ncbi:MAG: efflux RND transporter periplasmic adaptor subunit [Alphaproteobacteria bacterium]
MKKLLLILLLAAGVAAAAAGWWWSDGTDAAAQVPSVAVTRGDLEDSVTALGALQPRDYVDVGTQVSGQLRRIHVDIGDEVKQGDLLAELDPAVYVSRVEASRAQLDNLRAQREERLAQRRLADQQFRRQSGLVKANATSQEAFQSAEAALKIADAQIAGITAQIAQTESNLRGEETNLGYTTIYAPMNGTVVSVSARQGQTLNANQQAPIVLRLADLDTMTVWTQVSEADIGRLEIGMDAYFTTLGYGERRWQGTLRQILPTPEVVNNVVLYNALFDVRNPGQVLKPQMTAQVFFVRASARDVLTVPLAALQAAPRGRGDGRTGEAGGQGRRGEAGRADAGLPQGGPLEGGRPAEARDGTPRREAAQSIAQVQVVRPDGTLELRTVELGVRTRIAAEVRSGLAEGERVALQNQPGAGPAAPQRPPRGPRL